MSSRRRDERGAYLVLWALLLVALLTMVAIVVDLGHARQNRRQAQSVADFAALAAGQNFSTASGGRDPVSACRDAIRYINENIADLPAAIDPVAFCSQSGADVSQTTCTDPANPLTQAAPTTTSGDYTISVHYPVPDSEIADSRTGVRSNDGTACERLRVIVSEQNSTFFGRVVGVDSLRVEVSATMRREDPQSGQAPSLWLLDPTGCVSLNVQGGSQVEVGDVSLALPGLITIDSDGTTCNGMNTTIDVGGSGSSLKSVPTSGASKGTISLLAYPAGHTTCSGGAGTNDCDQGDVTSGQITPQPQNQPTRATRSPVDHRFDCKANYPAFHGITLDGCSGKDPYISQLVSAVGSGGSPGSGWMTWPSAAGDRCNAPPATFPAGNWYIDCDGSNGPKTFTVSGAVAFLGGNVVFDGPIKQTSGSLSFNTANATTNLPTACTAPAAIIGCVTNSSQQASYVYVRHGDLSVTGGTLNLNRTMLYLGNGVDSVSGGTAITWLAPTEGPFAGLALWADKAGTYTLNGGGSLNMEGIFFTPEATPFKLTGGGGSALQKAQFIAFHLEVSGGGTLTLAPDFANRVTYDPPAATLIR